MKRNQKYEKDEHDIHITRIITSFSSQQVTFLIFFDLIRQPPAISKIKIEVFIKKIDWKTINIATNRN